MEAKELLSKLKPIIIILLFSLVFYIRAEAFNLNGISENSKYFWQDENGQPYFSEMDSYYNLRLTQNYLKNGQLGDTIKGGEPWDNHSYAPEGRSAVYPPLIVYITVFTYKIANAFGDYPLTTVAYWIIAFIASLCVIPAYLFISRLTNDFGGVTAAILVATAPAYFIHSFAGFFDTDMFNVLMPILVIWFFTESIRADNIRNKTIFVVLSAISMFLFSTAWVGWWYIFYIIVGVSILYLIILHFFLNEKIKPLNDYQDKFSWFKDQRIIFTLLVFVLLSSILIMISKGTIAFFNDLFGAFGVINLQAAVQKTAYPNVFISVGELKIPEFMEVVSNVGIVAFIFGIICIPLLILKIKPDIIKIIKMGNKKAEKIPKRKTKPKRRKRANSKKDTVNKVKTEEKPKVIDPKLMEMRKIYLFYIVLFAVWILFTAYTVTKGVRFIEGFSIPMGLAAGISVGLMVPFVSKHIKNVKYCTVAMLVIVTLVSAPSVYSAHYISNYNVVPGTNNAMIESLGYIKYNTPQNTVITSWWDFGHLFAYVADRPVTFDGGTQNTPRAYWVGKALLTDNEDLSVGILRMLANGGDRGYDTLGNYTQDTAKSVEILDKILVANKQNAQAILVNEYKLTSEQAQNVIQYTHPDNSVPNLFITSSDMYNKAGAWSEFGSWDFNKNKGDTIFCRDLPVLVQEQNGKTVLIPQPIMDSTGIIHSVGGTIGGNNVDVKYKLARGDQSVTYKPYKLFIIRGGKIVKNDIINADGEINIGLDISNSASEAVCMKKGFENSVFMKLHLFRGAGMNKFKRVSEKPGVIIWKVS